MWALGVPLSLIIRHSPEQYGYFPDGEESTEPDSNPDVQSQDIEISIKETLKSRDFWHIGIAEAIRMMVLIAVITHIMPYLSSEGMPRSSAALVATSIPLPSIIGRFGFGWLGDKFDKRYVMAGAFSLMPKRHGSFFTFLLLFSPGYGGGTTLRGAILREYFGRKSFGRMLGIIMGIAVIGTVMGPSLAGWTFDSMGSYHPIWLVFAGTTLIAVILILIVRSSWKQAELARES